MTITKELSVVDAISHSGLVSDFIFSSFDRLLASVCHPPTGFDHCSTCAVHAPSARSPSVLPPPPASPTPARPPQLSPPPPRRPRWLSRAAPRSSSPARICGLGCRLTTMCVTYSQISLLSCIIQIFGSLLLCTARFRKRDLPEGVGRLIARFRRLRLCNRDLFTVRHTANSLLHSIQLLTLV